MGSHPNSQMSIARALDIAKESQNGQLPPAVNAILERKMTDIWQKINSQPTTYVMSQEEFAVFSYYRGRYSDNRVASAAVSRFWSNYRGTDSASSNTSTSTS